MNGPNILLIMTDQHRADLMTCAGRDLVPTPKPTPTSPTYRNRKAMNPRQRLLTTLRGGTPDRVPLILEGFHFASPDELQDSTKQEILSRVFDQVHYSHQVEAFVNRYLVTPPQRIRRISRQQRNGEVVTASEIDTPKGKLTATIATNPVTRTAWTIKYPVESLDDIDKIRSVPWERPPNLAPPDLSALPADFDTRGILRTGVSSPFVCVAGMMPYDYFLELCATHFELLVELTEICLERILDVLDVLLSKRNIEYVWMGGCEWLTPPMGSPRQYEGLVHHFEQQIIDRVHAADALSHVHCHGNVRSTIEMVAGRGADFFEPMEPPPDGDITMAEAKALVDGRMTLGGSVEARVLENESVEEVEAATRAAFEGGKERMVLQTSAGPLCAMTPRMTANYHKMIDVWEELSPIP